MIRKGGGGGGKSVARSYCAKFLIVHMSEPRLLLRKQKN